MPRTSTTSKTTTIPMPQPTAYQNLLLECPLSMDLVMPGPRGSGKSRGLLWLCARDVAVLKDKGRFLFLRASFPSLREVEADMRQFFPLIHPGAKYNASTCIWQFPNGATLELGYISDERSFTRYLGRSFSTILVDEATLHPQPDGIDILRSCLRAPDGTPTRMIVAGNPSFIGHEWFKSRWIIPAAPLEFMVPSVFWCEQTQRQTVVLQAEIKDNPHLDLAQYTRDLELAAGGDQNRLLGWLRGDWEISAVGAALADVFSERRSQTRFDCIPQAGEHGRLICTADYGTASPSAFYIGWHDQETRDLTLIDELYTCARGRDGRREYHRGTHQTVQELVHMVAEWLEPWQIKLSDLSITIDNSANSDHAGFNDTAIAAMRRAGMRAKPIDPRLKDRQAGYLVVRQRLANAGRTNRGLYWDRRCEAWRDTACLLERDPKTMESVAKSPLDHSFDSIRYMCMLVERAGISGTSYRIW